MGFASDNLLTARIGLFENAYPQEADRVTFWQRLVEELEAAPGVEAATVTSSLPATGMGGTWYRLEGKEYATRQEVPGANFATIGPRLFDTFDIPLRAGRAFTDQDRQESDLVVIVNSSFAEREWPGKSALGKRLRFGREDADGEEPAPWRRVVGVVPDTWMNDLMDDDTAGIYAPVAQMGSRFMSVAVKTRADPTAFITTLRQTVIGLDPDLPIYWTRTMDEVVGEKRFFFDLFGGLFATFGAVALLLAALGIYGITAFSVGRRTREIGVRMALGASPGDVLGLVLRQGAVRLALGLTFGLLVGIGVSRLLTGFLFGVAPTDPLTFSTIALFLSAVTLLACFIRPRTPCGSSRSRRCATSN